LQYTGLVISELLLLVPPMEQTGNRSGMHQKVLSTVDYSEACSWYQVTIRAALWSRLHDCCCGSVSSFAVYKWVLERIWNLTIHQGSSKCCCTEVSSLQSREWPTRPGCQWTNGRWLRKLATIFRCTLIAKTHWPESHDLPKSASWYCLVGYHADGSQIRAQLSLWISVQEQERTRTGSCWVVVETREQQHVPVRSSSLLPMGSGPGTAPKHQCLSLSVWYHNTGALSQKKFTFFLITTHLVNYYM